ncbi:MAG: hypothetical protein IJ461_06210 [Clostridia bacterium]|nr:hypothetical protein [Clostridia bacterium]
MEKILIMLPGSNAQAAYDTLESAVKNACYPQRLRLALALEDSQQERFKALAPASFGEREKLFALWQGEEYALLIPQGTIFERHWDLQLVAAHLRLKDDQALLTGWLPRPQDPFGPMPVAAQGFDEAGRLCFQPGTPMCYCSSAQRCAFIHPAFMFAPAAFFKQKKEWEEPLFLAAFEGGWQPYTLPVAALGHPQMPSPEPFDVKSLPPWQPKDPMGQFEKEYALDLMARRLSSAARLGLYTPDLQYDMQPPPHIQAREGLRRVALRKGQPSPLFVTAFREMACPVKHLSGEYESWFRHLARLKELPLLLYAKGGPARRARKHFSNMYEYQQRYGLPLERIWTPEEDLLQFKAGKAFLLSRTMASHPHHTHYAWIDFGYQRWPLYARTAFDWRPLCDDVIHLARVEGRIDPSLIVVPRELASFLCEEVLHEVAQGLESGGLPAEEEMLLSIAQRSPREFMLHDLDRKRGLLSLCHLS